MTREVACGGRGRDATMTLRPVVHAAMIGVPCAPKGSVRCAVVKPHGVVVVSPLAVVLLASES